MDFLLFRGQRVALRGDARAFLLHLVDPSAQSRLADTKRAAGLNEAVILLENEVGSLAFEFRGKGTALFGHLTPRSGEYSRLNGCPVSLDRYRQAYQDIGLELSPVGLTCLDKCETRYLSTDETLNTLTDRIRQLTGGKRYQRGKVDRLYQARDKQTKITEYVDRVLNRYSRTVVVRVDLHYLSVVQARLRVEDAFADQKRLVREIERNSIFGHLTGYICSVEQGEGRGYHIHAAFFFNGAEVRSDFHKARQIGQL